MRLFSFLVFFIIMGVGSVAAQSAGFSPMVETGHAKSQLLSNKAAISPGETLTLALHQELQKDWHVYWQNPGDSGLPLSLRWSLPTGYVSGDIQYPVPHRVPLGPLVNYGHEGVVTFLTDITAPMEAVPGTELVFEVDATWLICADICVPEDAHFSLSLDVVEAPVSAAPAAQRIFASARTNLPLAQAPDMIAAWADIDGSPVLSVRTAIIEQAENLYFFEGVGGTIEPSAPQKVIKEGDTAYLFFTPGFEYTPETLVTLEGVLAWKQDGYHGMMISAASGATIPQSVLTKRAAKATGQVATANPETENEPSAVPIAHTTGLLAILGLSLLGGIILNIMPCVFPVVFLKAASLAKSASEDRATIIRHGFLYTLGILIAFLAMAGLLMALRAGGEQIGWGFHLQSPVTVSVFAVVILLVGLNLAGLFEMGTSVQGVGSGLAAKGGNAGAFFTGLLAVAVAAPCIGPFLGVPVGYALSASPAIGFMVFGLIGLGLALPYLLISLMPGIANILPRPGPWMETFKQLMAFAMFATLIWLIWTLTIQAGTHGLVLLLIALLLAGFAAWAFGKAQIGGGLVLRVLALLALIGAGWVIMDITAVARAPLATSAPGEGDMTQLPTVAYSEMALADYRAAGTPVFVDFTAAWCVTCQFNKQTVLKRPQIIKAFHEKNVIYMVADWTVQDPEITKALEKQGRSGVPLYLYYAPGVDQPLVLPQTLSVSLMLKTFEAL